MVLHGEAILNAGDWTYIARSSLLNNCQIRFTTAARSVNRKESPIAKKRQPGRSANGAHYTSMGQRPM
jgi:hypothetical protein